MTDPTVNGLLLAAITTLAGVVVFYILMNKDGANNE